jgi:murein DD-endopeptidase MepM/ murein hydrolase activator NlpD
MKVVFLAGSLTICHFLAGQTEGLAQTPLPCAAPDTFLPPGNLRTSEAGVVRVYKVGSDGKIGRQPPGYPKTVIDPTVPLEVADDEIPRIHEGIDYSSRDLHKRPAPLEFKAGVYGSVRVARKGLIEIQIDDAGNRVQFLHNSSVVQGIVQGAKVTPGTVLGNTGSVNPTTGRPMAGMGIHLHVQARNRNGEALNPCDAIEYASKPEAPRKPATFFVPLKWVDLKPLKPVDWNEFRDDAQAKPKQTLFFDENVPKKK